MHFAIIALISVVVARISISLGARLGLALEAVPAYVSLAVYFLVFGLHCAFVLDLLSIQSRE